MPIAGCVICLVILLWTADSSHSRELTGIKALHEAQQLLGRYMQESAVPRESWLTLIETCLAIHNNGPDSQTRLEALRMAARASLAVYQHSQMPEDRRRTVDLLRKYNGEAVHLKERGGRKLFAERFHPRPRSKTPHVALSLDASSDKPRRNNRPRVPVPNRHRVLGDGGVIEGGFRKTQPSAAIKRDRKAWRKRPPFSAHGGPYRECPLIPSEWATSRSPLPTVRRDPRPGRFDTLNPKSPPFDANPAAWPVRLGVGATGWSPQEATQPNGITWNARDLPSISSRYKRKSNVIDEKVLPPQTPFPSPAGAAPAFRTGNPFFSSDEVDPERWGSQAGHSHGAPAPLPVRIWQNRPSENPARKLARRAQMSLRAQRNPPATTRGSPAIRRQFPKGKPPDSRQTASLPPVSLNDARPAKSPVSKSSKPYTVVIDPGHGGKDPGAISADGRLKEKNVTLGVARRLQRVLRSLYPHVHVVLTRSDDTFMTPEDRAAVANASGGDLFISIHCNASTDHACRGIETYYLSKACSRKAMETAARENGIPLDRLTDLDAALLDRKLEKGKAESDKLSGIVHHSVMKHLARLTDRADDRGVRRAPFRVLLGAQMPAVMVEIAFITNEKDTRRMQHKAYLESLARGMASGAVSYLENRDKQP